MTTNGEPFPLDWNEWRGQWEAWRSARASDLKPTSFRFPGKNFMADAILGTWAINDRNVELSELTFPDLSKPPMSGEQVRLVGVTFGTGAMSDGGAVVATFAELEEVLGLDPLTDLLNSAPWEGEDNA